METEKIKPLSLKETAEVLVKHYGFHEGLFDITFEVKIGVGNFGPTAESSMPGAMFGIGSVSLVKSPRAGAHTVDASVVNPIPKRVAGKIKSK